MTSKSLSSTEGMENKWRIERNGNDVKGAQKHVRYVILAAIHIDI
jgi:hypothetical protein